MQEVGKAGRSRSERIWVRWSRSSLAECYAFLSVLRQSRETVLHAEAARRTDRQQATTPTPRQVRLNELLLNTTGVMRHVWGTKDLQLDERLLGLPP